MTGEPRESSDDWLRTELDGLRAMEFGGEMSAPTQVLIDLYTRASEIPFSKIKESHDVDVYIGDVPYAMSLVGSTQQGLVFELMDEDVEVQRVVILNSLYFGRSIDEIPDEVKNKAMSADCSTVAVGRFVAHDDSDFPFIASRYGLCKDSHLVIQSVYTVDEARQGVEKGKFDNVPVLLTKFTHLSGEEEVVAVSMLRTMTVDPITWAGMKTSDNKLIKIGIKPTSSNLD